MSRAVLRAHKNAHWRPNVLDQFRGSFGRSQKARFLGIPRELFTKFYFLPMSPAVMRASVRTPETLVTSHRDCMDERIEWTLPPGRHLRWSPPSRKKPPRQSNVAAAFPN
ncbi:unnamed protein product, partial [Iphiclides podalirius]